MSSYDSAYAVGNAIGGFAVGMMIFLGFIVLIAIAVLVLKIIGEWKILVKGGKPGWGALIPFYNQYLLCDMVGISPWWILIVFVCGCLSFIPVIGSLLSLAASIYFAIILNVSIARSFGKEDSYAVGLILLQPIFYLILGCGEAKYEGKKPMDDVIMNSITKNAQSSSTSTAKSSDTKFCTACGNKMDKDTKFCPACGKEVK